VGEGVKDVTYAAIVHGSWRLPTVDTVIRIVHCVLEHDVGDAFGN
jgi:hypothetical protein